MAFTVAYFRQVLDSTMLKFPIDDLLDEKQCYEHRTVCHGDGEYGRDEDGDDFCGVHSNTIEGIWTGCATSCAASEASRSPTSRSTWLCSSLHTIIRSSSGHPEQFWAFSRAMLLPGFTFSPT